MLCLFKARAPLTSVVVLRALNFCSGDPGFSLQLSDNLYLSGSSSPTSASQIHSCSMGGPKPEKDAVGDQEGMNAVNAFCLKTAQVFTESSWKHVH